MGYELLLSLEIRSTSTSGSPSVTAAYLYALTADDVARCVGSKVLWAGLADTLSAPCDAGRLVAVTEGALPSSSGSRRGRRRMQSGGSHPYLKLFDVRYELFDSSARFASQSRTTDDVSQAASAGGNAPVAFGASAGEAITTLVQGMNAVLSSHNVQVEVVRAHTLASVSPGGGALVLSETVYVSGNATSSASTAYASTAVSPSPALSPSLSASALVSLSPSLSASALV